MKFDEIVHTTFLQFYIKTCWEFTPLFCLFLTFNTFKAYDANFITPRALPLCNADETICRVHASEGS